MDTVHPHKIGKMLGVIHEDTPQLHPIDLVASATPPQRPTTYLLDPTGPFFSLKALMQGFTSQCGGYSLAQLINFLTAKQNGTSPVDLSGSFDYAFEKTIDGVPNEEGTTISALGKAGNLAGSCLKTLFPDDGALDLTPADFTDTKYSTATQQAMQDALTRKLGTPFALTDLSIAGIHQACFEYGAVILEVEVGDEWYTAPDGTESWDASQLLPIHPPKAVIDSHFILVGPYDEPNDRTHFINSWSQQWADNGFGYFGSNYAPFIKAGIAFKEVPASVTAILNTPTIETPQKQALIQTIINDIEQALGLVGKELGQL